MKTYEDRLLNDLINSNDDIWYIKTNSGKNYKLLITPKYRCAEILEYPLFPTWEAVMAFIDKIRQGRVTA